MDQIKKVKAHSGDVYALEILVDEDLKRTGLLLTGGDYTLKLWNSEVILMRCRISLDL